MGRIETKFDELAKRGKKALITFITAGDPDMEKSFSILQALPDAGADLIEIGMPFSDPAADGPIIQESSGRAIENGTNLNDIFQMVKTFRESDDKTPVILMGYFNTVYAFGNDAFAQKASESGVDGLIIVDLPPEEDAELRTPAQNAGINIIRLVTPMTDDERLENIVLKDAGGFLYYVSITGITGTKSASTKDVQQHIERIKKLTDLPVAVGFGIRTPKDVQEMIQICDAVVVGSAIVENIKNNADDKNLAGIISKQVNALASGL